MAIANRKIAKSRLGRFSIKSTILDLNNLLLAKIIIYSQY
jgi:hypothetical protein